MLWQQRGLGSGWRGQGLKTCLDPQVCDFLLFFRVLIFFTVYSTYDDEDVDSDNKGWDQRDKGTHISTPKYVIFYSFLDY